MQTLHIEASLTESPIEHGPRGSRDNTRYLSLTIKIQDPTDVERILGQALDNIHHTLAPDSFLMPTVERVTTTETVEEEVEETIYANDIEEEDEDEEEEHWEPVPDGFEYTDDDGDTLQVNYAEDGSPVVQTTRGIAVLLTPDFAVLRRVPAQKDPA